jgi:hypothetical protein
MTVVYLATEFYSFLIMMGRWNYKYNTDVFPLRLNEEDINIHLSMYVSLNLTEDGPHRNKIAQTTLILTCVYITIYTYTSTYTSTLTRKSTL